MVVRLTNILSRHSSPCCIYAVGAWPPCHGSLIVLLAAIVGLWLFRKLNEGPQTSSGQPVAKQKVENPFVLYYEKESVEGNKVFRFVLQLEGRREKAQDGKEALRWYKAACSAGSKPACGFAESINPETGNLRYFEDRK